MTYKNKIKSVHLLATKFTIITKMHGATHIKVDVRVVSLSLSLSLSLFPVFHCSLVPSLFFAMFIRFIASSDVTLFYFISLLPTSFPVVVLFSSFRRCAQYSLRPPVVPHACYMSIQLERVVSRSIQHVCVTPSFYSMTFISFNTFCNFFAKIVYVLNNFFFL
jgi:hypothetical protein